MKKLTISCIVFFSAIGWSNAQQIDLVKALAGGELETHYESQATVAPYNGKSGVASSGIVWLKGADFKEGQIDIDLKGKNILQKSFLGIAFHGKDTISYEVLYFRPFNFGSADTLRQKHCVQYMKMPDHPWYQLRKENPLVYENAVRPVPDPEDWFHATLIIRNGWIRVYVNHSPVPSLKIRELASQINGKIGLWSDGLPGEFASLQIKSSPSAENHIHK